MSRKAKQKSKQSNDKGSAKDNVATLPISPGQRLRQAREKAGLTQAEVAERLFLHAGFVAYLEEDNFDQLPGPTFVKGYIKSYSRLVGLSPDPLIALYKEHHPDQEFAEYIDTQPCEPKVAKMTVPPPDAMPDFKEPTPARRKMSYLPHLLGILAVSAGITYVATQDDGIGKTQKALSFLLPGSAEESVDPSDIGTDAGSDGGRAPATIDVPIKKEASAPSSAVGNSEKMQAIALDVPAVNPNDTGRPRAIWTSDHPPGMAISYQIQLPAGEVADKTHRLKLTFLEKSRVLVRDGAGTVAHNEEHAKGAEVRVALLGPPPYKLSLSQATAVSVSFDGEPLKLPNVAP